jgi:hypothetical protein
MFSSRRRSVSSVDAHNERQLAAARLPHAPEAIAGPCDRCPAEAAVRVQLPSASLLMLCGDHARQYAPALLLQGAEVTGELASATATGPTAGTGAK